MTASTAAAGFHPVDLRDAADPFDALAGLTARCPVSRQTHERFDPITLVAGYEEAMDVYHRREEFSNRFGHSIAPEPGELFDAKTVFTMDGGAHRRIRRILVEALTPRSVEAATPYMVDLARRVVAEIPDTGRAELRAAWATRIPGKVVAHMIGVPEADHADFFGWTMQKLATLAKMTQGTATLADLRAVEAPFDEYLRGLLRVRRDAVSPSEDILSRLLCLADESGRRLEDDEIIANAMFLLNAGNQTTQNLLTNLVHQLVSSGEWMRVRADRTLVDPAIEESLRLTPPIQYGVRRPLADVAIGGCPVAAGTPVVLSNLAANRDPRVWGEDAARFRVDRATSAKHLGFGAGPHACIGTAVARRIARVAMNALLDRFELLRLAPDFAWTRQSYWTSLGMVSLEVAW